MSSKEPSPLELTLMSEALALDLAVQALKVTKLDGDNVLVTMQLRDEIELLSGCVWGLIYTIGALSFEAAPLHGNLEADLSGGDRWNVGDMLAHLAFANGKLQFHADVVRGRCMRTMMVVDQGGTIFIQTVDRGQALARWIARLRDNGMPHLSDRRIGDDDPSAYS